METALLRLHGFPVSNYTNMVHLALLEKGLPFEYVTTFPDQSPDYLAKSPRGKVPCLETPHGFINEASVILEYLEERGEGKALLPADPFPEGLVRALIKRSSSNRAAARSCFSERSSDCRSPRPSRKSARELSRVATLSAGSSADSREP